MANTFVGIGFGAIQGGLFLREAARSGSFDRLVVAEVLPEVVEAVREVGAFSINIATATGVEQETIDGVEILNPADCADGRALVEAISEASAIATALPSVDFYDKGSPSVAELLADGLKTSTKKGSAKPCVIYAAENHNRAAERLGSAVYQRLDDETSAHVRTHCCFANTVIGKMSQVLVDREGIDSLDLARVVPGLDRAFLVEAFNRILVSQCDLDPAPVGMDVFVEKPDLLPFEEAKLYGHNATHALVGYMAHQKGYETMSAALGNPDLRGRARDAFIHESGVALIAKHGGVDPLFTPGGYMRYADDLLRRMSNVHLEDRVDRIIRDPARKLGWDDRLIGMIRLALRAGVEPVRYALATVAALRIVAPTLSRSGVSDTLRLLWRGASTEREEVDAVVGCVERAFTAQEAKRM